MPDKATDALLDALKQALAEPAEQRLFRVGKLAGLFSSRSGPSAEAAERAVRDGLLEVVRTEAKGKVATEWVRPTPQAVQFLHEHESARKVLEELRDTLRLSREGIPVWLSEMRRDLQALGARLTEEAARWSQRLETLSRRVEEALRRAEADVAPTVNGTGADKAWVGEALVYLDQRREGGVGGICPFPELYAALRGKFADLSLIQFHDGLRRLQERRALQLVPFTGPPNELPQPEYALPDGATMLYYAAR